MKLKILIVGAIALTLTACFLDDDVVVKAKNIRVITVSGETVILDGTLERPCDTRSAGEGGNDYLVTEFISGLSGVKTEFSYTSTNGDCTGTETVDLVVEVTFTRGDVMAITGWVDLDGTLVNAPLAQDASGLLSNNESVTSLTLTIDSVTPPDPGIPVGTEAPSFYVVDDTVPSAPVLYGISGDDDQKAYNVPLTPQ